MAEHIPNNHEDGEIPKSKETQPGVPLRIEENRCVEGLRFHDQRLVTSPPAEVLGSSGCSPSRTRASGLGKRIECQPGANCRVVCRTFPSRSRHLISVFTSFVLSHAPRPKWMS